MHRFYVPPEQCSGSIITLEGREAHHANDVLRAKKGGEVVILNGAGRELRCEISSVSPRQITLQVLEARSVPPLPCQITLLQAVPKGKTFGLIVEKATELGAHRIVPILTERTVSQLDAESGASKVEKWRQIAVESIKQCGSAWLPVIEPPTAPKEFLARKELFELPLIASLQDKVLPKTRIESFIAAKNRPPNTLCIWIGPEGDFSPAEMSMIIGEGVLPITLGPLVLRSETAAIYCLSVLNHEMQAATKRAAI